MSARFTTSAGDMKRFSSHIADVNSRIQQELRRLESVVGTVAEGWTGEAASAYQALQSRWNADAGRLNTVLGEIREAIDATSAQYSGTEADQGSTMSRITAALN